MSDSNRNPTEAIRADRTQIDNIEANGIIEKLLEEGKKIKEENEADENSLFEIIYVYDIPDADKYGDRVRNKLRDELIKIGGIRIQKSVYLCKISGIQRQFLEIKLNDIVHKCRTTYNRIINKNQQNRQKYNIRNKYGIIALYVNGMDIVCP